MSDVRDIVTDALRELGVLAAAETATADDAMSGLQALNRLIDQWAVERLMIHRVTRTTFALVSGTQAYTLGTGGSINVVRPAYIDHLNLYDSTDSPVVETALTPLTDDAWSSVMSKATTSPGPGYYYYNPTFPLGTLSLWPTPTGTSLVGVLYAPQQVSEFAATSAGLATAISLPPGYRRMLVKNLALEMAPSYERQPSGELKEQAIDSKAAVKTANIRLMDMSIDPSMLGGIGGGYNINTG